MTTFAIVGLRWLRTQLVRSGSQRRSGPKTADLIRIGIGVWLTVAEKEFTESRTSEIAAKLELLRRRRVEGELEIFEDRFRALRRTGEQSLKFSQTKT